MRVAIDVVAALFVAACIGYAFYAAWKTPDETGQD